MLSNDAMKRLSDEIAAQVHKEQKGNFAQLLSFARLVDGGAPPMSRAEEVPAEGRIGVWQREDGAGHFVRDLAATADWAYWAQEHSLPIHCEGTRVLFLGESAARGMFYDPGYTPAGVLQGILAKQQGEQPPVVVDLARTNASMNTLRQTARQAEQLQPDAVVIFAGNNWAGNRSYLGEEHTFVLASSLRDGGVHGLRRELEMILSREVERLVEDVAALYAVRGVPVCWVLPEFNLADWRDPKLHAHWLAEPGANEAWLAHLSRAEAMLTAKDFAGARAAGETMLALDKGDCAATAYLLAECHHGLGQEVERRQYLEMARDASVVDFTRSYSPRMTSLIRKLLHDGAARAGHEVVDLAEVFAEASGTRVPGQDLFLDYCHLTSEGIRLAMAAVGQCLLARQNGASVPVATLRNIAAAPDDGDEADANLLAAIHNAHWGQSREVVLRYCRQAAAKSSSALELMQVIAKIQNERLPVWMNARATELLETVSPQVKRYLFSMEFKCLDRLLLDAFASCCSEHGIDMAASLAESRVAVHAVESLGKVDLLDPYYHSTSFSNQQFIEGGVNQANDFYKAYEPTSSFCFVASGYADRTLRITLKSGDGRRGGQVGVSINGVACGTLAMSDTWITHELRVPGDTLVRGVNEVAIDWPTPSLDGGARLVRAAEDILLGATAEVYPIYGHIYLLQVEKDAVHEAVTWAA